MMAKLPPEDFIFYASSSCNDNPLNCKNDGIIFKTTKPPRVHEEFDPCTAKNDLALVELDQNIPSTVGSPICMIEKDEHLAKELAVLGYGYDPNHPTPENSIFNRLEMMKIDSVDVKEWNTTKKLEASLKEKMICGGDSGGPLVQIDQEGKYSVIGISSTSGPFNCSMPVPHGSRRSSDFIDLRYYTDWICTHTGQRSS
ncbi:trypsin [Teladorsagia circumcincta]|uniref:Trypsin n=1 Tax=Teladorsagia circumcincta TaxID=45464 RepID=A0A2G9U5K8_TELCI|nr:trypsin [Teladorsagia circumcincta]